MQDSYDYIIVGGGSAGCVLAKRLSEDSECRVLLVEAGGNDSNPFIRMPAGVGELLRHPWVNWYFYTQPEKYLDNRRLYWPRGKVMGGSSSINAMVYTRGHRNDYDRWGALPGCESWNYDSVLPWFRHSENFAEGANEYHGDSGELGVTRSHLDISLMDELPAAAKAAGFPLNSDFNGADQEGVGRFHVTIKDGVRQSTSRAFLTPDVKARPNLDIMTKTRVTRLLIDGKRVTGVEAQRGKHRIQLQAYREVLLTAGSVQSPQLLLLSGIGPGKELDRNGIKQQQELPGVGQNLQDHLDVSVQYHCTQKAGLYNQMRFHRALMTLIQFLVTHQGMGTSNGVEMGGFVKTPLAGEEPDVQLHYIPTILLDHGREKPKGHGFMLHACQLRPHSRGQIRLDSSDPLADPLIEANYLSDERDLPVLIEAVKLCRKIFAQSAFDAFRGKELMPGEEAQSDEAIAAAIRRTAETIYHPVGTCRMGSAEDDMAVVDKDCRLHGMNGVRVVDASVFPNLIGGNTNAPTIMVAERVAHAISSAG